MSDYGTNKKTLSKEVNYLGRDFTDIRENLIEFAKSYFPNQYNDFNEASPGMMFVEMAAYVGDVLNYYVDNQFRETLIEFAEERKNVLSIAQSYGYKPRLATPAIVEMTFSIDVPAVAIDANNYKPDLDYAGKIQSNSTLVANNGTEFTLLDDVDFKVSSSLDNMEVKALQPTSGNIPTNFRLTKKGMAQSGVREEETFSFTNAKEFDKIILSNDKVTSIVEVTDSEGCMAQSETFTIWRQDDFIVDLQTSIDPNCEGNFVSQINDITISGGVPPYSINWSSGSVSIDDSSVMTAYENGTYTVLVTDSFGCQIETEIIVDFAELGDASFDLTSSGQIDCGISIFND